MILPGDFKWPSNRAQSKRRNFIADRINNNYPHSDLSMVFRPQKLANLFWPNKKSRWMLVRAPNAEKARMKWKTLPKSSNTKRGTPIPNWALDEAQAAPSQDGSVRTKERVGQCTCVSLALFNYAKVNGAGYITTHKGARAEALAEAQRESGGALRPLWYPHAVVPPSLVWRSQLVAKRLLIRSLRLRSADTQTDCSEKETRNAPLPPHGSIARRPRARAKVGHSSLIFHYRMWCTWGGADHIYCNFACNSALCHDFGPI